MFQQQQANYVNVKMTLINFNKVSHDSKLEIDH
jgi:hypothetical protein